MMLMLEIFPYKGMDGTRNLLVRNIKSLPFVYVINV